MDFSTQRFVRFFTVLMATAALSFTAFGFDEEEEEEINQNPMTAEWIAPIKEIRPGEQRELAISVQLVEGYHAYADKFKLKATNKDILSGRLNISPINKFEDTFSGKMKDGVKGVATIKSVVEFPESLKLGKQQLEFKLTFQACTKKHCLFPKKLPLLLDVNVVENLSAPVALASASDSAASQGGDGTSSAGAGFWATFKSAVSGDISFKEVAGQGLLFSLIVIFIAGILTSLTPCVYPMIPITLAVIGTKSEGVSRFRSFTLSLVYVLGIALMFSSLGVAAAMTGSLFGSALSHPAVVFTLAGIFVVLGLSMYGAFEIQAPAFIRNRVGGGSKKSGGFGGALFAGLVSGIVAGPCVGPVLIGVLTHVGEKQDALYGFSLLLSYSFGMGLLFILLGTFSGLMNKLPRAGGWMDSSKFVFGSIMIAMALYYVKPFTNDRIFALLLGLTLICVSSVYGAFADNASLKVIGRIRKGAMITVFAVGVFNVILGVFNPSFSAAPTNNNVAAAKSAWKTYSKERVDQALAEGKPVIIDFWAEWCVACKELEKFTFSHPDVMALNHEFVLLKFDATESTKEVLDMSSKYNVIGLPTVLFMSAEGKVVEGLTLTGFEEGPEFAERMRKTLARRSSRSQAAN